MFPGPRVLYSEFSFRVTWVYQNVKGRGLSPPTLAQITDELFKFNIQIPYCCFQLQRDFTFYFYKVKFLVLYHFISKRETSSVWAPTF